MSDTQTSQEPTMEEILASIRRIISEDDAPEGEEGAAVAEETPQEPVVAEPEPVAAEDESGDDVLELTEPLEPVAPASDLDVYPSEPEPASPPPSPAVDLDEERLVSDTAAHAAASAFGSLSAAITMPRDGRTLEDVVRELLRPLLKAWLDEHLPRIVETKVAEEVERIARGRVS